LFVHGLNPPAAADSEVQARTRRVAIENEGLGGFEAVGDCGSSDTPLSVKGGRAPYPTPGILPSRVRKYLKRTEIGLLLDPRVRKHIKTNDLLLNRFCGVHSQVRKKPMQRNEDRRKDSQKVLYHACQ
jgi:hypothetical protein